MLAAVVAAVAADGCLLMVCVQMSEETFMRVCPTEEGLLEGSLYMMIVWRIAGTAGGC